MKFAGINEHGIVAALWTVPVVNETTVFPSGYSVIECHEDLDVGKFWHDGTKFIRLPVQPSPNHILDINLKDWVLDLSMVETEVRLKRNALLYESDWTDTVSAQRRMSEVLFEAWATYRQVLRDITEQPGFPTQINWPEKPII